MAIAVVIPFYEGERGTRPNRCTPKSWLRQTIDSVSSFADKIFVGIGEEASKETLLKEFPEVEIIEMFDIDDCYNMLTRVNREFQKLCDPYDFVYYTEADQEIQCPEDIAPIVDFVGKNKSYYVAPHRIELACNGYDASVSHNMLLEPLQHKGLSWTLCNIDKRKNAPLESNPYFRQSTDHIAGYGGAFFCHTELYKRTNFKDMGGRPSMEYGSGFHVFQTGTCFKTTTPKHFMVHHLSGTYNNKKHGATYGNNL